MRRLLGTLLALLCGGASALAAQAQVGTVDMEKVFRGYYKTKVIEQDFQEQGKVYRNYIARQGELLRKDEAGWKKLRDEALNFALSGEERVKRQKSANDQELLLKNRRAELEQYTAERSRALQESAAKARKQVIDEIRAEVKRRAILEKLALVLDSSGFTLNDTPVVVYAAPNLDITEKVLTELNRAATPAAKTSQP